MRKKEKGGERNNREEGKREEGDGEEDQQNREKEKRDRATYVRRDRDSERLTQRHTYRYKKNRDKRENETHIT